MKWERELFPRNREFSSNIRETCTARRVLRNVAGDPETRRPTAVESKRPVKAGAVLIREWHGTKHQVTALEDGLTATNETPFASNTSTILAKSESDLVSRSTTTT